MTRKFESIDEAQAHALMILKPDPPIFEEILDFSPVCGMIDCSMLNDHRADKEIKQNIRERIKAQRAFEFKYSNDDKGQIIIEPFRNGFCCWLVGENGQCIRL